MNDPVWFHNQELINPEWFNIPPFELLQEEKEERLSQQLQVLHKYHRENCVEYSRIFAHSTGSVQKLTELPFLAVRLFKYLNLSSVPSAQIYKTVYSSGTSGQVPAKIILDQETSRRQSKVLVKVLQDFIGKQRLPMLIIDHPSILVSRDTYSARGAGIQGVSFFGRKQIFALNDDMTINEEAIGNFASEFGDQPVLLFGFTFLVWQQFLRVLKNSDIQMSFPKGILLHSGGWKKLEAKKVTNTEFKRQCSDLLDVKRVHNFYGMAEQVGSVFVECEYGHMHAPVYADIIIRHPQTFHELEVGESGLIQVLSMVPSSYPGNSLLTEDLGTVLGMDDCPCGRKGKYFSVHGRLPKAEIRGCSDTSA